MSRIGKFNFSDSVKLHVVNTRGDSVPITEDAEVDVECVLHCDDDGEVYAEDVKATITVSGNVIELDDDAITVLDLSERAGELFYDSRVLRPSAGEKYMDATGRIWSVMASGRKYDETHAYTMLERYGPRTPGYGVVHTVVETHDLVHPAMEGEEREEQVLAWRRVIEEDEPQGTNLRQADAVYVGKPKGV